MSEALNFETQAAQWLRDRMDVEPTRGYLFRSAASIAWQINRWDGAIRLAANGLAGNPPAHLVQDILDVIQLGQSGQHIDLLE